MIHPQVVRSMLKSENLCALLDLGRAVRSNINLVNHKPEWETITIRSDFTRLPFTRRLSQVNVGGYQKPTCHAADPVYPFFANRKRKKKIWGGRLVRRSWGRWGGSGSASCLQVDLKHMEKVADRELGVSLLTLISPLIRTFDLESGLSCLSATESGNCIVILGNAHVFFFVLLA